MASKPGKSVRCAIYTRKSTEHGLELEFNSLDAQREACEAYIKSQTHEGWKALPKRYDDPAYSGGNLDRPALQKLLDDIDMGRVDVVVVYKIDRLTRSLSDFAKLVELFDEKAISFVAVTQQFNTTTSMGRLTLNVLLSFAQFERELSSERVRDKVAASRKKGKWTGGGVPLGYDTKDKKLVVNQPEAKPSATSIGAISTSNVCDASPPTLMSRESCRSKEPIHPDAIQAGSGLPMAPSPISSKTEPTLAKWATRALGSPASTKRSSIPRFSTQFKSF